MDVVLQTLQREFFRVGIFAVSLVGGNLADPELDLVVGLVHVADAGGVLEDLQVLLQLLDRLILRTFQIEE